jgi:hypothetical protein
MVLWLAARFLGLPHFSCLDFFLGHHSVSSRRYEDRKRDDESAGRKSNDEKEANKEQDDAVVMEDDCVDSGRGTPQDSSDHPNAREHLLCLAFMGTGASVDSMHMVGVRLRTGPAAADIVPSSGHRATANGAMGSSFGGYGGQISPRSTRRRKPYLGPCASRLVVMSRHGSGKDPPKKRPSSRIQREAEASQRAMPPLTARKGMAPHKAELKGSWRMQGQPIEASLAQRTPLSTSPTKELTRITRRNDVNILYRGRKTQRAILPAPPPSKEDGKKHTFTLAPFDPDVLFI